jgi:hypothetical protein
MSVRNALFPSEPVSESDPGKGSDRCVGVAVGFTTRSPDTGVGENTAARGVRS